MIALYPFGAEPLPKPSVTYKQMGHKEQTVVEF